MGLLPPFWRTESVFCGQPGHLGDHMAAAFHGSREGTSLRRAPKAELRGRLGQKVDPHPELAGQGFGARDTAGWEVPAWSLCCCVTRETS